MAEIPNLAGVATQDLVETIGSGNYKANYINWARTIDLLHEHAPGWSAEMMPCPSGGWVHPAPGSGGFLMIRFVHLDGTRLPGYPQSIMDNRNNAIHLDKITARDVTDTHRRGTCMAAAMQFGLGYELWAKMPLESGYSRASEFDSDTEAVAPAKVEKKPQATREEFLEACIAKGLTTYAAENLLQIVGENYAGGIKTLSSKTLEWVDQQNKDADSAPKSKPATSKKSSPKPDPSEY